MGLVFYCNGENILVFFLSLSPPFIIITSTSSSPLFLPAPGDQSNGSAVSLGHPSPAWEPRQLTPSVPCSRLHPADVGVVANGWAALQLLLGGPSVVHQTPNQLKTGVRWTTESSISNTIPALPLAHLNRPIACHPYIPYRIFQGHGQSVVLWPLRAGVCIHAPVHHLLTTLDST